MKTERIPPIKVSFKQREKYLEEYIRSKGDYSNYIKDLIKKDYKNNK